MKVIMYPSITIDGFIANLKGECYSWINPDDEARYEKLVERCSCVLVGRRTYEQYQSDYPSKKDVVTFVCTSQETYKDEEKLKFIHGTPQEMLASIEQASFSEVVLCGGGEVNGLFASHGLIDEIILSINSVSLGEGIPLFGSYKPQLNLELLSTNTDIEGVVQNHYRVVK